MAVAMEGGKLVEEKMVLRTLLCSSMMGISLLRLTRNQFSHLDLTRSAVSLPASFTALLKSLYNIPSSSTAARRRSLYHCLVGLSVAILRQSFVPWASVVASVLLSELSASSSPMAEWSLLLKLLGIPTPRNPHYQALAISPIWLTPLRLPVAKYLASQDYNRDIPLTTTIQEYMHNRSTSF